MKHFASLVVTLLALLLAWSYDAVEPLPIASDPAHAQKSHVVQKRSSEMEVLGILAVEQFEILNEDTNNDKLLDEPLPGSCKEIFDSNYNATGYYRVNPGNQSEFTVFCDMSLREGGWTVILRRVDGSVTFDRNWMDYKNGFGPLSGNFWLGLQKIKYIVDHDLPNCAGQTKYELYIGLQSFVPEHAAFGLRFAWALYEYFTLADEEGKYELNVNDTVSGMSTYDESESTAGDALAWHSGIKFSTPDQDHDLDSANCAAILKAGWWYRTTIDSHLTGEYYPGGGDGSNTNGILWKLWRGDTESLKTVVMAIRPRCAVANK